MAANDFTPNPSLGQAYKDLSGSAQASAGAAVFDEAKGAAGRVQSITAQGGPLMQAARTRAKQASAKSGLLNSSLAGQAGEQAVLETATPLAQTDASLYNQTQIANANNSTQASIANAQLRGQIGLAGLNMGENARQFDVTAGWEKEKFGGTLMEQRRQFDATLGLESKKLGQSQSQFDATLGLEGKKLDQQGSQFDKDLALQRDNLAAQREQFAQKFGLDSQQLQLNRDQLGQQDRQFLAELDQKEKQLGQQESQFQREQNTKITLANMDAASREKLVQMESANKKEIAGNENISRAWGSMMDSISQIQNNPDLDSYAKQVMIQNAQSGFQTFTNFWKKLSGGTVDVSDLLNFGPAVPPSQPGSGQGGGGGNVLDDSQLQGVG